ncbi:serine-rich adhesin for platelets-like isoform X2 [Haliotis rubra]|uniref:serine-rich adhesin for platelets-like isoform X2 n=1 Tax=Haliotis rubra TaxID=36100 RepID=UPI001EE50670|nr:serine-rich adhesin for platelets-like isoform X2 [Haliotis rubra]
MRYSQEFTPDGPFIYAHEEVTSDVCVSESSSDTSLTKDKEVTVKDKDVVKKLFASESTAGVCKQGKEASASKPSPPIKVTFSESASAESVSSTSAMSSPCIMEGGGECMAMDHCSSFLSKNTEISSKLFDSGVDCGVGDSMLSSSKLSECMSLRTESGITIREKDTKSVLSNFFENDSGENDEMVFAQPRSRLGFAHSSQIASVSDNVLSNTLPRKFGHSHHAGTNYAGSFLSDMEHAESVSDISDNDGFKRPFRLQGVLGMQTCQTNISTPRMASTAPSFPFASPHLLVSPIATYKANPSNESVASSKSSDSTPSKLVKSSVSAFSSFPASTAVRRSLRKKTMDESSMLVEPKINLSDSDVTKRDFGVGTSDMVTSCGNTTCPGMSDSQVSHISRDESSSATVTNSVPPKPVMTTTSTQSDYLCLPSTLAGQQLLLVKSSELAKGQLESSPESLVSQSSWSDLKLSALGINKERLCFATVSSDSSSLPTQSSDTNVTTSSDVQKPDLVSESDKPVGQRSEVRDDAGQRSEVREEQVLESLGNKQRSLNVNSSSPSTECELGMSEEYFTLNDNESSTPDLFKSHKCDDYKDGEFSGDTQSQTDDQDDDDIDSSELDTLLPGPDCQTTILDNDYSPIKGRGYERRQRQFQQRPGLIWPNRYMSDSESSETEDLGEHSFDSGSSDSSLLDYSASDSFEAMSPPPKPEPVIINDGKLKPWRPPGHVEVKVKKSSEVKGTKKGSSFRFGSSSSNKENQTKGRLYPKSPLPKNDCKSDKDKKKTPCRRKKQSDLTEMEIDEMTKLHTTCNGQRVVRYLNFSESPMIIKHYPAPKEASKLSWSNTLTNCELTYHSPTRKPSKPTAKPILTQRPLTHTYPYSDDVPSPIILTRTRRTHTLSQRVTQL